MIQTKEASTFERRFGTRCPLCNEPWSSEKKCGPPEERRTIQQSLNLLFAPRIVRCVACDRQIPGGRKYCLDCGVSVRTNYNRADRHARVTDQCVVCSSTFERRADKKDQRCCSVSCANRARHARRGREEHAA